MAHGQPTTEVDGQELRRRRERAGLSLRGLADLCIAAGQKASDSQLSKIEREVCRPRPRLLVTLASVLPNTDYDDLIKKPGAAA